MVINVCFSFLLKNSLSSVFCFLVFFESLRFNFLLISSTQKNLKRSNIVENFSLACAFARSKIKKRLYFSSRYGRKFKNFLLTRSFCITQKSSPGIFPGRIFGGPEKIGFLRQAIFPELLRRHVSQPKSAQLWRNRCAISHRFARFSGDRRAALDHSFSLR